MYSRAYPVGTEEFEHFEQAGAYSATGDRDAGRMDQRSSLQPVLLGVTAQGRLRDWR